MTDEHKSKLEEHKPECFRDVTILLKTADQLMVNFGEPWPVSYAREGLREGLAAEVGKAGYAKRVEELMERVAHDVVTEAEGQAPDLPASVHEKLMGFLDDALKNSKPLTVDGQSSRQIWGKAHRQITALALDELISCVCPGESK